MHTLALTWDDLSQASKLLARKLAATQVQWDAMVAVTRGGLIPAGLISHELDIRHIETICIASYEESTRIQRMPKVIKNLSQKWPNVLVIDDLVDTGKTFQLVQKMLPQAQYAALYAKPKGLNVVNHYVREVTQDTWIVFPWETSPLTAASNICHDDIDKRRLRLQEDRV